MIKLKNIVVPYLLVLIFPILFYALYKADQPKEPNNGVFQFYTSVQSQHVTRLDFYQGDHILSSWDGPFTTYKQLDYVKSSPIKTDTVFKLGIVHEQANDTLSFLGLHFLIDGIVYTLQPEQLNTLRLSPNAKLLVHDGQLKIICRDKYNIVLEMNSPLSWSNNSIKDLQRIYLIVIFFLFVLAVILARPDLYWFSVSALVCLSMTFYFWYLGKDPSAQISITKFTPNEAATFYFNSQPVFNPSLSVTHNDTIDVRKTQGYPGKYVFYRIDFPDKKQDLSNTSVTYAMGILRHSWALNKLSPFDINGNGLDYRHGKFSAAGADPYLSLTSAPITHRIKQLDFIRTNLYMVFALFVFAGMISLPKLFKLHPDPQHLLIFPFLSICFGSLLLSLADERRLIMSEEKRLAYPLPVYDKTQPVKEYTKQLDNYLKDQLPGRGQLIIANNYIKYKTFSELATNPMVYFGKKGWMFYIGENVKETYENKQLYTEEELKKMTRNLEERRDWLKEQGISYYILFPRMSHYFYQENVGEGLHQYNKKPKLEQFLDYLQKHSTVNIIDVYAPMLAAKKKYPRDLYYRSDSHWNLFGAYFAYAAVIERIQKDYPQIKNPIPLNEINWVEAESEEADLSKLISLSGVITRHEFLPLHADVNSSRALAAPNYPEYHSVHPLIVYQGTDVSTPSIVMNRDSYSNFLIPYFCKHFNRQTYVWSPLFFPTIIEKEKPDIVISEMMERFLTDLLIDNPPLPLKNKEGSAK